MKKVFIEYLDGDRLVKGTFDLVKKTENYIEIKTGKNNITIPFHRINKIKEKLE